MNPNKTNSNRATLIHDIIKLLKMEGEEKIIKAEKTNTLHKGEH